MPFSSKQTGRLLLVHWEGAPTVEDVERVDRIVASLRKVTRKGIVYIAVIPSHVASQPTAPARKAFTRGMRALEEQCDQVHVVAEGNDTAGVLLRGLLRTLNVVARASRGMKIHASVEPALRDAAAIVPDEIEAIRRDPAVAGWLNGAAG